MVIVTIEIGHQANFLKEPSIEGFTHDWTVFVGGYEGSKIEHFVEKVVFNLHKTFKMPTRVISAPPYKVSECGYAGFILPIDIYFKTKQKPRKITFMYDLFLNAKDSPPINNVRYEKLKFQNPTPEFKAKLIKAGGIEQGSGPVQPVVSDRFYNSENKVSSKPQEKKHKEKKVKKKSPPVIQSSPNPSLSSLSPMSSDEEPEKPVLSKKEKEPPPLKKEFSSSSYMRKESSSSKDKSTKHKSSAEKERHRSEKNKDAKPHKVKEKDKSSTEHHKEVKKEKESGSHKSKDSHGKHKDREGSHSSNKSSSSSLGEKKSSSSSHKEKSSKEKDSGSREKHKSSHKPRDSEEKSSFKEKEKHSHKEKDSSLSASMTDPPKKSHEFSKSKSSQDKDKDKHSKHSHKRALSPGEAFESEKKKMKRSNSSVESEGKVSKITSAEKEKIRTKDGKDVKLKDSHKQSSSSGLKSKEHKKKSHDKSQHSNHSLEGKSKPGRDSTSKERKGSSSEKHSEVHHRSGKSEKTESFSKSEKLAMSTDFQLEVLLSPLSNRLEDEESHSSVGDSHTEVSSLKKRKSNSSSNSLSSLSSDHEGEKQTEETKLIVSGLTDSDSESDGLPVSKSPQKEVKPAMSSKENIPVKPKKSTSVSAVEKIKKSHNENGNRKDTSSPTTKRNGSHDAKDHTKKREDKEKSKVNDLNEVFSSPKNSGAEQSKHGMNVLAPNGIPIGELISINEKIERAQQDSNKDLINSIIDVIADTDDFDIDDSAVFFDICSLDKSSILQIQNILRD